MERVRPVSITHKDHFVNIARRRASDANKLAAEQRATKSEASGKIGVKDEISNQGECLPISSTDCKGGFFADQFENLANFRAHYEGTGHEIWDQTGGNLDGFVAAAGTGGTLAGVSRFLKVLLLLFSSHILLSLLYLEILSSGFKYVQMFSGKESKY